MLLNLGLAMVSIACKRRQLEKLLGVPDPRCTLPKNVQNGFMREEGVRVLSG